MQNLNDLQILSIFDPVSQINFVHVYTLIIIKIFTGIETRVSSQVDCPRLLLFSNAWIQYCRGLPIIVNNENFFYLFNT